MVQWEMHAVLLVMCGVLAAADAGRCAECLEALRTCVSTPNDAGNFVTGRTTTTCACCAAYDACVGAAECETAPTVCLRAQCTSWAYIGYIVVVVAAVAVLVVVGAFFVCYLLRRKKAVGLEDNNARQKVLDMKLRDIQMYQRLAEIVLRSSTSSSSSDEELTVVADKK